MWIGLVASIFFFFFLPLASKFGAWYPYQLAFSAVVGFICSIGFWKMKKWSVILYVAFCVLNQIILLSTGTWQILALLLPGIVIAILYSKYSLME